MIFLKLDGTELKEKVSSLVGRAFLMIFHIQIVKQLSVGVSQQVGKYMFGLYVPPRKTGMSEAGSPIFALSLQ